MASRWPGPGALVLAAALLGACVAPDFQQVTEAVSDPVLDSYFFITHDGVHLPLRTWMPDDS